jgi:hypothetical protein
MTLCFLWGWNWVFNSVYWLDELCGFKGLIDIFLVVDVPLCLKYNIKMEYNMYCLTHNHIFMLLFQLFATSFGLNNESEWDPI